MLRVVSLTAAYAVTGWLGLELAFQQENATLVWPPTGLSLAALFVWGRRMWVGVWLGAFTVNLLNETTVPVSLGFAMGNTLMAVVGAQLLTHVFDFRPSLERIRDVITLVFVGGALASVLSASMGAATLWSNGGIPAAEIPTVFSIWWRGDLGGVIAVTPLLLLLQGDRSVWRSLFEETKYWIAMGCVLLALGFAYAGFESIVWSGIALSAVFPILHWAAIQLGVRGAVSLSSVFLLVSAVATGMGLGPMAELDPNMTNGLLWICIVATSFTSLILAVAVSQRDLAEEQHEQETIERLRIEREQMIAKERERIMRDMHDTIGGQLTSVLSMVQRGSASKDEVAEALRRTLDDMRIMIDSLDASEVDFPRMIGRLRARLEPVLRRNGLHASWNIAPLDALGLFDPTQARHALRIIQEAVANVVQHAQATQVAIRIFAPDPTAQTIAIEIADNGIGPKSGSTTGGHGIRNMTERAKALGAELSLEVRDAGYCVSLLIPVSSLG